MAPLEDEQAIRALVNAWLSATAAGNSDQVLKLIADDVVFLTAGAPPMRKPDFAAAQAGLKQVELHMVSDIQEIRVMGDLAYCWNKLTVTVTPRSGGKSITRSGNALSILEKRAGAWLVIRDANMLAVVP